jgi:hypothetical protein
MEFTRASKMETSSDNWVYHFVLKPAQSPRLEAELNENTIKTMTGRNRKQ